MLQVMRCKPSMIRPSQNKSTPGAQQQQGGGNQQQRGGPRGGMDNRPQKVPGFNVAYVGNIAFETSLEELQELFQPCVPRCAFAFAFDPSSAWICSIVTVVEH
jgi:hypothetical protein